MKSPIVPILVIALILGGAYYYFFVMNKPDKTTEKKVEDKPSEKTAEVPSWLKDAPKNTSEDIASMFSGDEWRKAHPILI